MKKLNITLLLLLGQFIAFAQTDTTGFFQIGLYGKEILTE